MHLLFNNKVIILLEDQYHAFFICPRFAEERTWFLLNWYNDDRARAGFYFLLKSNNVVTIIKLAIFVSKIMEMFHNQNLVVNLDQHDL